MKSLDRNELEVLLFLYKDQKDEIMFRREREFRIFTWSNTIFLALMGLLIVVKQSESILWIQFGISGKVAASATIIFLLFFSIYFQHRERLFGNKNEEIIARINRLLHCFDKGYFDSNTEETLFPKEWINWGKRDVLSPRRFLRTNFITATWLLGLMDFIAIWIY